MRDTHPNNRRNSSPSESSARKHKLVRLCTWESWELTTCQRRLLWNPFGALHSKARSPKKGDDGVSELISRFVVRVICACLLYVKANKLKATGLLASLERQYDRAPSQPLLFSEGHPIHSLNVTEILPLLMANDLNSRAIHKQITNEFVRLLGGKRTPHQTITYVASGRSNDILVNTIQTAVSRVWGRVEYTAKVSIPALSYDRLVDCSPGVPICDLLNGQDRRENYKRDRSLVASTHEGERSIWADR